MPDDDATADFAPYAVPLREYVYATAAHGLPPEFAVALLCAYSGAAASEFVRKQFSPQLDDPVAVTAFINVALEFIETHLNYPEGLLPTWEDVLALRLPATEPPAEPSSFWPPGS